MIPWKAHPYLKEIRQGYAIIALKGQENLHYPIGYLPMSMRQLERLLSTLKVIQGRGLGFGWVCYAG